MTKLSFSTWQPSSREYRWLTTILVAGIVVLSLASGYYHNAYQNETKRLQNLKLRCNPTQK